MKSYFWRVIFLVLVVASASCSSKDQNEPESSARASAASDPVPSIDDWRDQTFAGKDADKVWEQYSQAAQAELAKPGSDPSDVVAKAKSLDLDPQKVFEFMRDQVSLEPYSGLLRGSRGTLAAAAGNALDRALLAQELLKVGGIESRLVAGTLSAAQAESLLDRFLNDRPVPSILAELIETPSEASLNAEAADLSAKTGLPETNVKNLLQRARSKGEEFWAQTNAQRATQYDFLSSQLRQGGSEVAIDAAALTATLRERLRKHYWLQIKEPNGTWTDFDPAFADSKRSTVNVSGSVLSEIPTDQTHQLEFSLVYLTVTDDAPKEEVLIAGTFSTAAALFEPLEFRIQPTDLGVQPADLAAMDPKKRIEVLRKIRRFQGVLRTGSKLTGSRVFDLDGSTYDPTAGPSALAGGTFFGDALGGGEENSPEFVELRVVMRFTGPGRKSMRQTRTLVRAEDTMAPAFAPPLLEWAVFVQPQWVSADLVAFRALEQVVAAGNAVIEASKSGRPIGNIDSRSSIPTLLLQMALLRQRAAANILANQDGIKAFIDEPMLTILGHRLTGIHDQDGQISGERRIDIVENAVRYVTKNKASQLAAFDAALRQSVADSIIEDRILREIFPGMTTQSGATILEQVQSQKRTALLVNVQDVGKLRSSGVTEANIAWMRENESPATRLLVATTASGSNAWWSVRPDGNAILRIDGGLGGDLAEYPLIIAKMSMALLCWYEYNVGQREARRSGGQWSGHNSAAVAFCATATFLAGGLFVGGLAVHSLHLVSWALFGAELTHYAIDWATGGH